MGQFLEKPQVELGRPGQFVTCGPTVYLSDIAGEVVVPKGFETDFASIPSAVPRRLFDPMRHGRWAAVVHDYLCRQAQTHTDRVQADKVFLEILLEDERLQRWRARCMYAAVRLNTFRMWLFGKWR